MPGIASPSALCAIVLLAYIRFFFLVEGTVAARLIVVSC